MSEAVLVTGLGIVAPNGFGVTEYWSAICAGRSAIDRVTHFDPGQYPAKLAAEVPGFVASEHLSSRLIPQTDRMTQLALVGADHAMADAGVRPGEQGEFGMGVMTASTSGGFEFGQDQLRNLWSKGSQYVSAYQSFAWFYAVNTGQISIRHGMRGPSGVLVSDQAGGLDAIAHSCRLIRGGSDLILSGGVDAAICPWGWVAQLAGGRLSTSEYPDQAYLPFDPTASGHVPGEGGAFLVLESERTARSRGAAQIYGEISGYGSTFDPAPDSGRPSSLGKAIEIALESARISPDEVDVVFADAAAVPVLDRTEAAAIREIFGPRRVAVTAPKTMTGRLGSGAGPLDVATALLAMRWGLIPPTVNVTPDPEYGLDLVTRPRPARLDVALVLARGQGGFNSAIVLRSGDRNPPKERIHEDA